MATATNLAPAAAAGQPVTTTTYGYGSEYGWTAEELAAARPAVANTTAAVPAPHPTSPGVYQPAATAGMVYPRTYTRTAGTYGGYRR